MKAFPFKSQYRSEPWGGSWGRRALAKHLQTMHLSHLVTMPFFRAARSISFIYHLACLIVHQCGWLLAFRGLVLIVQYLANEGENRSQHPPLQLKNRESLVERGMQAGTTVVMSLALFLKVHPQPLPGQNRVTA